MIKILNYTDRNFKRIYGRFLWSWIAPCNCKNINHNDGGNYD